MKKNELARAVFQARKDKQPIAASIRLKKNGKFSSVCGTVEDLRASMDGFVYLTIKKDGDRPYQSVRLENILSLRKDGKLYKK